MVPSQGLFYKAKTSKYNIILDVRPIRKANLGGI